MYPWVGVVRTTAGGLKKIGNSPQFSSLQETKMAARQTQRSHRKIRDYEQSNWCSIAERSIRYARPISRGGKTERTPGWSTSESYLIRVLVIENRTKGYFLAVVWAGNQGREYCTLRMAGAQSVHACWRLYRVIEFAAKGCLDINSLLLAVYRVTGVNR